MPPRIASPGLLTPSSTMSYDYISARSATGTASWADSFGTVSDGFYSDEEEILYRVSSLSSSLVSGMASQRGVASGARSPAVFSDGDYIVMSRARSPASSDATSSDSQEVIEAELSAAISSLSISRVPGAVPALATPTATRFDMRRALGMHPVHSTAPAVQPRRFKKMKAKKTAVASADSPAPSNANSFDKKDKVKRRKERRKAQRQAERAAASTSAHAPTMTSSGAEAGLGERPIVDDVSEAGDMAVTGAYQDAVTFINSFLSNPTVKSGAVHLRLLQALIVELGLCPSAFSSPSSLSFPSLPSLPHSLRAAKALLKSQVFLNVRDYLAVRGQGLNALRNVMHRDRSSLMREIRAGKRMPVKAVKDAGLNVLLITCQ